MFAELPDVRMYYEDEGSGEPVILIAGVGANHRFWKTMVPLLKGYRVITLDNRGVGETEYKGEIQIDIMADDVIHLMDYLHILKAHIVGWSMGSQISQSLAIRHPKRLQSLTLVSSYQFRPHRSAYFMYQMTKAAAEGRCTMDEVNLLLNSFCFPESAFAAYAKKGTIMPVPRHPEDPREVYKQMTSMDNFDTTERTKDITAPSLVIHGGMDIMVEPLKGRAIGNSIPKCTYIELPGEGHTIAPELYIDALKKHLRDNRMAPSKE
ncbi:putative hydrolases or acyltransferases (alpha/beta hydrolase superfamily) [Thermoplasmatales archaeon BRNA1]|nr:putative hydrolases or acyltransferases (alpha/beta hydrolase superfamily) [Thermoplasmatales archaeon BRNA1]